MRNFWGRGLRIFFLWGGGRLRNFRGVNIILLFREGLNFFGRGDIFFGRGWEFFGGRDKIFRVG